MRLQIEAVYNGETCDGRTTALALAMFIHTDTPMWVQLADELANPNTPGAASTVETVDGTLIGLVITKEGTDGKATEH